MAALAYLLPPLSGMLTYFSWAGPRTKFHGAQAICFGLIWAVASFAASALSSALTQVVAAAGVLVWLLLIVTTAIGKDVRLPVVGSICSRAVPYERG